MGQHSVTAVNPLTSRLWIQTPTTPTSVQYFSCNTPVGAASGGECGRVVFTDIHVSSGDSAMGAFPSGCKTEDLSPQEKALAFMLFDLSSCVQPDQQAPMPPKLIE
jgi:hypothetical protein